MFDAIKSLNTEYKPTRIIADNDYAISNAFNSAFGECEKRINCWAHCIRNIDNEMAEYNVEKNNRAKVRKDICDLQLCQSSTVFHKAAELFNEKWNEKEKQFTGYFIKNWINTKNGWYEGYSIVDLSPRKKFRYRNV